VASGWSDLRYGRRRTTAGRRFAPNVEVDFTPKFQSHVKNSAEAFAATPAASLEVFWPMPAVAGLAESISITIFQSGIRIA
jgi:hypothetical protein